MITLYALLGVFEHDQSMEVSWSVRIGPHAWFSSNVHGGGSFNCIDEKQKYDC